MFCQDRARISCHPERSRVISRSSLNDLRDPSPPRARVAFFIPVHCLNAESMPELAEVEYFKSAWTFRHWKSCDQIAQPHTSEFFVGTDTRALA